MGLSSNDPGVRIYQTRERQTFHTDSADIVALLCLQRPARAACRPLCRPHAVQRDARAPSGSGGRAVRAAGHRPARRGPPERQAVLRDTGLQLACGTPVGDLPAPVHRLGAALCRRAAPEHEAGGGAGPARCPRRRTCTALHDAPAARRHAVRAQPRAAARPHGVRGLAGAEPAAPPAAPVAGAEAGWPLPDSSRSATAASGPAHAAASQAPTGACGRTWIRWREPPRVCPPEGQWAVASTGVSVCMAHRHCPCLRTHTDVSVIFCVTPPSDRPRGERDCSTV